MERRPNNKRLFDGDRQEWIKNQLEIMFPGKVVMIATLPISKNEKQGLQTQES